MGHACCRHHVERTRPNRRCRHHDLAAALGLGKANGRQRHGLFILAAPRGEGVLHGFQRFRQTGHIAMAENAEDTGEQRDFLTIHNGVLVHQIAHQTLAPWSNGLWTWELLLNLEI